MKIRIDKASETPVHLQLREQIIFLISTGELPIGHVMPSVRELERRLKIHRNTVDLVYAELVAERWLVKRPGSRLVVVQQGKTTSVESGDDLEALIDRTLSVARKKGLSIPQLAARLLEHANSEPPDHFVIVEPERGMGEIMKYEIREATGQTATSYSMVDLQKRPSLLIGAVVLAPAYLIDLVAAITSKTQMTVVPVTYTKLDTYVEAVRKLVRPSIIGMASVSEAGMKTLTGPMADAIGARHSLCHYLMEWPARGKGDPVFRRYTVKSQAPEVPVRVGPEYSGKPGDASGSAQTVPHSGPLSQHPLASMADLQVVDLLFCDSITYHAVRHRNRLKYQLLSDASLREITAVKLQSGSN